MKLRTGKAGSLVLDRSVYKRLGGVWCPGDVQGRHGSAAEERLPGGNEEFLLHATAGQAVHPAVWHSGQTGWLSVIRAANDLVAEGIRPETAQTVVLLPEGCEEETLRLLEDQIREAAEEIGLCITGGFTEVTSAVTRPVVMTAVQGTPFPAGSTSKTAEGAGSGCESEEFVSSAGKRDRGRQQNSKPEERDRGRQQNAKPEERDHERQHNDQLEGRDRGKQQNARPEGSGRDETWHVIIAGRVGMEGTYLLATERDEELQQRFPARFLGQCGRLRQELYSGPIVETILRSAGEEEPFRKPNDCPVPAGTEPVPDSFGHRQESNLLANPPCQDGGAGRKDTKEPPVLTCASEGGIFAALWNFAERTSRTLQLHGFDLDLLRIPIYQQTIEITDYYDINPYELASAGSVIAAVRNPLQVISALNEAGFQAADVGTLHKGPARCLHNEDEVRYLDRPAPDSLLKIQGFA